MIENLMKVMNVRMNLSGVLTVIHIRRQVSARTEIFLKNFEKIQSTNLRLLHTSVVSSF